jgi:hypothetical protein
LGESVREGDVTWMSTTFPIHSGYVWRSLWKAWSYMKRKNGSG